MTLIERPRKRRTRAGSGSSVSSGEVEIAPGPPGGAHEANDPEVQVLFILTGNPCVAECYAPFAECLREEWRLRKMKTELHVEVVAFHRPRRGASKTATLMPALLPTREDLAQDLENHGNGAQTQNWLDFHYGGLETFFRDWERSGTGRSGRGRQVARRPKLRDTWLLAHSYGCFHALPLHERFGFGQVFLAGPFLMRPPRGVSFSDAALGAKNLAPKAPAHVLGVLTEANAHTTLSFWSMFYRWSEGVQVWRSRARANKSTGCCRRIAVEVVFVANRLFVERFIMEFLVCTLFWDVFLLRICLPALVLFQLFWLRVWRSYGTDQDLLERALRRARDMQDPQRKSGDVPGAGDVPLPASEAVRVMQRAASSALARVVLKTVCVEYNCLKPLQRFGDRYLFIDRNRFGLSGTAAGGAGADATAAAPAVLEELEAEADDGADAADDFRREGTVMLRKGGKIKHVKSKSPPAIRWQKGFLNDVQGLLPFSSPSAEGSAANPDENRWRRPVRIALPSSAVLTVPSGAESVTASKRGDFDYNVVDAATEAARAGAGTETDADTQRTAQWTTPHLLFPDADPWAHEEIWYNWPERFRHRLHGVSHGFPTNLSHCWLVAKRVLDLSRVGVS